MEYRVRPGDTLFAIAARFDVSLATLEKANSQIVDFDLIFPDDLIHVPASGGSPPVGQPTPVPPPLTSYIVQPDDTLSGIAFSHGLTLAAIELANPQITDPSLIQPGQVVNLNGSVPPQRHHHHASSGNGGTVSGAAAIDIGAVTYDLFDGDGDVTAWTRQACKVMHVPASDWVVGYQTLCRRESSGRANAINASDLNAHGPIVDDGYPLHCSRGVAQCIPDTFAGNHIAHTSTSIYDPVANIAASMHYVMQRYGVFHDGSNLAVQVQQADPNRSPMGY